MRAEHRRPRLCCLAACLSGVFGAPLATVTAANTLNVSSCADDNSAGTLRKVVAAAANGDTVDLHTQLPFACSTITLQHGEIPVTVANLSLQGPSNHALTIEAGDSSRVLNHSGTGHLQIDHLTLADGKYLSASGDAKGGCVFSNGSVYLTEARLTGCFATSKAASGYAEGGAVFAGFVSLDHSEVVANFARAYNNSTALGGGIAAFGGVVVTSSTISSNAAIPVGNAADAKGGGIWNHGPITLAASTLDGNQASEGGAIFHYGLGLLSGDVTISNSTVSGNRAVSAAGIYNATPIFTTLPPPGFEKSTLTLNNSTVAFNTATSSFSGVFTRTDYVQVNSSILARNTRSNAPFDDLAIDGTANSLSGAANLIQTTDLPLPDSLTADPRLAPLADHGGGVRTHALLATSPAVDAGSNTTNLISDQRGAGFARVVGGADIGAYERQIADDEIYYGGFE